MLKLAQSVVGVLATHLVIIAQTVVRLANVLVEIEVGRAQERAVTVDTNSSNRSA